MAVWNGKFDSSIKMLHQMKQDGLMPDIVTYSMLLAGCIKVKHGYSKALELVRELQHNGLHMDSVIYGTLLAVCASNTKLEEAESYFNWMKDEGHSSNVFHYSSLLNAYSISGNYRKADELVQDMKSAGSENYSFDYCNVFREFDVVMMAKFLIAAEKFLLPSETAV
nr:pentatricopeptide repeat-containing protein, chloroplastic [Quercus suber]